MFSCFVSSAMWCLLIAGFLAIRAYADGSCSIQTSWHTPGAHDGFNIHEHGAQPPEWAGDAFDQCRESHQGYKGVLASSNGKESYLVAHIISTVGARSHGDHDYKLAIRESNGNVSKWGRSGASNTTVLDYGTPPLLLNYKDAQARPSIQLPAGSLREFWMHHRTSKFIQVQWNIYDRMTNLDGSLTGDNGTNRAIEWIVDGTRLNNSDLVTLSPTLVCNPYCLFGIGNTEYQPRNSKGQLVPLIGTPN